MRLQALHHDGKGAGQELDSGELASTKTPNEAFLFWRSCRGRDTTYILAALLRQLSDQRGPRTLL